MSTNSRVPLGPLLHCSGGEMFCPSCVYLTGRMLSLPIAGLLICIPHSPPLSAPLEASLASVLRPPAPAARTTSATNNVMNEDEMNRVLMGCWAPSVLLSVADMRREAVGFNLRGACADNNVQCRAEARAA